MLLAGFAAAAPARGAVEREQVIPLQSGWNAVFLEVYPAQPDPAVLFSGAPVDMAASLHAASSTAQFIANPGADLFRRAGWGVWYSEERPDAFLKTLHAIVGQQAYLIHATRPWTWTVSGAPVMAETRWEANAYNFAGFSVDPVAPPTFARFFAGSKAHRLDKIYRLRSGAWQRVDNAAGETIRSGEAFWIYCDGASAYQGPLQVETPTRAGLVLAGSSSALVLRNLTDFPAGRHPGACGRGHKHRAAVLCSGGRRRRPPERPQHGRPHAQRPMDASAASPGGRRFTAGALRAAARGDDRPAARIPPENLHRPGDSQLGARLGPAR